MGYESEIGFDAKIAQTVGKLSDLASKALADFADGKTLNIGFGLVHTLITTK